MGKNVQLPARLALFRNLVDRGIIFAVQWAISLPDREEASKSMISAGGEVLSTLLDHDLNGVRSHVIKHVDAIERERGAKKKYAEKGETLLDAMCRIMATTKDMAVQSQIGDALKTWLEIPPAPPPAPATASSEAGGSGGAPGGGEGSGPPPKAQVKKEGDTERFLDYFYKNCASVLFKPLMELPEWKNVKGMVSMPPIVCQPLISSLTEPILPLYREEANRFTYLADLFHSFVAQHGFRSQLFCITSSILGRIASLLKAKDKHLRHCECTLFYNPFTILMALSLF
jgi:protein phosphatase-4 regulatory subunit 3